MEKYSKSFVAIHWLHAILLSFLLIGGMIKMPDLPKAGADVSQFKMHMIVGFVTGLIFLIRLVLLRKQPTLPLYESSKQKLVDWNHRLIYLFIATTAISGIVMAKLSNIGSVAVFGADPSSYTGPIATVNTLASIHATSAYILAGLIVMHVLGVIMYTIQTKNKIIQRMTF